MKQNKLQKMKQKGFTLLELLVVITLLAILSVGALIAYEGIGDTAQATAASRNTAQTDQAIRNYRAVTQAYPDQWDNLVANTTGVAPEFATTLGGWLASLPLAVPTLETDGSARLVRALNAVGIEELQTRTIDDATPGVEPNLQHNEGAVNLVSPGDVQEEALIAPADPLNPTLLVGGSLDTTHVAILPSFGDGAACGFEDTALTFPANKLNGAAIAAADAFRMNRIHDDLEDDQCNLVVALGFGHDAAHSTNGSSVAISTAPTYISKNVNPTTNYARYVALFHVGQDVDEDNVINDSDIFEKARLLAVVDTEGNAIDQNIADATAQEQN
jgi:prepilin-type N-terminal cleavage/methylation domain-containing protein